MKNILKNKSNTCIVCNAMGVDFNIDFNNFIRSIKRDKAFIIFSNH